MIHPTPMPQLISQPGAAGYTELSAAADRLREEHRYLIGLLEEMERQAMDVGKAPTKTQAWSKLQYLRLWAMGVMQELEAHSSWEEQELIPFLTLYFRLDDGPTLAPSFWQLEMEHKLAEEYIEAFMREFHKLRPDSTREALWKVSALLVQAGYILKNHLCKEEELVMPLVDQVLTDMDGLFS